MTHFRARQWGSASWTYVDISEDDEDEGLEALFSGLVGDAIDLSGLHVQQLIEGEWEDRG